MEERIEIEENGFERERWGGKVLSRGRKSRGPQEGGEIRYIKNIKFTYLQVCVSCRAIAS